ncbi:MAG TPA: hypothetical protein DCY35_05765 [Prolixibacteraceae bacterium]|jgi:hypothetical protein|nr:hypothetical protein [Prolixibacteraceae bacterium]
MIIEKYIKTFRSPVFQGAEGVMISYPVVHSKAKNYGIRYQENLILSIFINNIVFSVAGRGQTLGRVK